MQTDLEIYANALVGVRDRINKVLAIFHTEIADADLRAEMIFTQLRKMTEGMAFALLAANKIDYSSAYKDGETAWSAKRLFTKLEAINPDFYPIPLLEPLVHVPGVKHYQRVPDGFLTREDFELLYDRASAVMHLRNPYSQGPTVIDVKYTIEEWMQRFQELLSLHAVRVLSGDVWLASVPATGDVRVAFATQLPWNEEDAA